MWRPHLPARPGRATGTRAACRRYGCLDEWEPLTVNGIPGQVRICQRTACRRVTSVVIYGQSPCIAAGIDATCSTDNRPALDWPGCTD